jgi:superfamily II DNA/RNA helicase
MYLHERKIMSNQPINIFKERYNISLDVCKALEIMGYTEPMKVQDEVIRDVQALTDLIVQSKTGSGKTAAFGIPIVNALTVEENLPQVLVLTPTRELAVQVCQELSDIGRYKKIRCLPIYGKQPIHIQLRQLKQRVHVAVGTPGRVADLIKRKHLETEGIKYLVIDEADELLKRGFLEEVEGIIQKMPSDRVTLLFSATMPAAIEGICARYMQSPKRIEVESEEAPIDQIKQGYIEAADDWKFLRLKEIIDGQQPGSCMIFCNTRAKVDQLTEKLKIGRYSCASLHGKMAQKYRLRAIDDFKNGQIQFLVATDLAARGIHVNQLDLVVNYNVPNEVENYVHRIGRTGRAGEKGEAITFVNVHDLAKWEEIQNYIGYKVPKIENLSGNKATNSQQNSLSNKGTKISQANKPNQFKKKEKEKRHQDITRLRINAGRTKKIRPGDILGAVSNIPGINSEDIGIIDIQDTCSYLEIHNNKGELAFNALGKTKVKGRVVTVKKLKL